MDPMFEVFEALNDHEHQEHQNILSDIKSLDSDALTEFVAKFHLDEMIDRQSDKDIAKRARFLVYILQNQINEQRKEKLTEIIERRAPYNSSNLSEIEINDNQLVKMEVFDLSYYNLMYNEMVYMICPVTESSNSSYWLSQVIFKLQIENNVNFKVRLDPLKEIHKDQYNPIMYKMHVHGKPLDWNKLKSLRFDDFGQWFNEKDYEKAGFTDYVWSPKKDNTIHFTCEEVPKLGYNGILSSRYFHAIFDKNTGRINHCDGAIRFYTEEELANRVRYQVKDPDARKVGKRIKIFQFDSKDNNDVELGQDDFCDLAVNFFVWNQDVMNYFN
ncbi:hypothetical protein OOZ15_12440 [Galbibacter sp. EGI 63066]|uniref:hypothetical protein n=1 Tax=Galbibacter sp. EGI 63066 TaxID=2993559 RepID=UPI00224997F4|nr:hypothetical protein [Galbibacter sp. EGI 63066]MCX2680753.1 hypothetical protein [Galbibacter sp. EGI 63066]